MSDSMNEAEVFGIASKIAKVTAEMVSEECEGDAERATAVGLIVTGALLSASVDAGGLDLDEASEMVRGIAERIDG